MHFTWKPFYGNFFFPGDDSIHGWKRVAKWDQYMKSDVN